MVMTTNDLRVIRQQLTDRIMTRVSSMVRRITVGGVNADGDVLTATGTVHGGDLGELHEDTEVLQMYGVTSVPPDGSTAVLLCPGGDTAHDILIAVGDSRVRLTGLGAGEVAMYVGNEAGDGARVILRADGNVEVQPGPGGVVRLGEAAPAPAPAVARDGDPVELTAVAQLHADLTTWVPVVNDGGAALKTVMGLPGGFLTLSAPEVGTITGGGTGSVST